MTFQPGQSGNPGGRTKERPFRDALRMEEAAAARGDDCEAKPGSLRWIARKQLLRAGEDHAAASEIADRLDGKVPQSIGGSDELPPVGFIVTGVKRPDDADNQT